MARLPTPGGDKDNWGNVLNEFLSQEHNPDGTLKESVDSSLGQHIADTDISASSLHHTLGTGHNQAATGDHTHAATATNLTDLQDTTITSPLAGDSLVYSGSEWLHSSNGQCVEGADGVGWNGTMVVAEFNTALPLSTQAVYQNWPPVRGYEDDDFDF